MTSRDRTSAARILLALALSWAAALAAGGCSEEARELVAPESAGAATPVLLDDDDDGEFEEGVVLVRLAPGVAIGVINARYGTRTLERLDSRRLFRLEIPAGVTLEELLARMRSDPDIVTAEPNFLLESPEADGSSMAFADPTLEEPDYEDQGALDRIRAAAAWPDSRGEGVLVAILDTGVAAGHPSLRNRIAPGGRDFVDGDNDPADRRDGRDSDGDGLVDEAFGHGTFVAGLSLAVAPGARVLPIRILDDDGVGTSFDVAQGVEHGIGRGADVVNLSFGMTGDSDVLEELLEETAEERGVVFVASAGNRGVSAPQYPAAEEDVLGVAATTRADRRASFSNYGSWVRVAAPGEGLVAPYPGGGYAIWSGTSFSTALTSGAAAVLASARPGASGAAVTRAIVAGAAQIADPLLSCGRLDVKGALERLLSGGGGGGGGGDDGVDGDGMGDD